MSLWRHWTEILPHSALLHSAVTHCAILLHSTLVYPTPLYSALPSRILLKICPIFFFLLLLLLPLFFFLFYSFSLSSLIAVSFSSLRYLGLHLNKKYASGPFFFMLPLPLGVAYFWHYCDARFKKTSLVIEFTPCPSSHGNDILAAEDRRGFDEVADTSNRPSGLSSCCLLSSNIISSYLVLFHLIYLISSHLIVTFLDSPFHLISSFSFAMCTVYGIPFNRHVATYHLISYHLHFAELHRDINALLCCTALHHIN